MAAHRTNSTTHWLNSIQSETDIIRPPQLPASLCCGRESTNWTKRNFNCLLLLANVVFVQSLENCTVCTQHSMWLPNWIFYSVCFKSLVCLLKMDASVLGVKKVQIKYKRSKKEKAVILDTVCKNVKNMYCKHCSLSHIHPSCRYRSCLDAWRSAVFCALMCVQCSVSQSVSNLLVSSFILQSTWFIWSCRIHRL